MKTLLTTLLTAVLTALVGAPVLQPTTIFAVEEAEALPEIANPTTLTVGEIRLSVEDLTELKVGETTTFTVVARNLGEKKGKASAKARVSVQPRVEEFSRMIAIPTPVADIPIEASLAPGATDRINLESAAKLSPGDTVTVAIGEGDRWVAAASFTVPMPPPAEPAK